LKEIEFLETAMLTQKSIQLTIAVLAFVITGHLLTIETLAAGEANGESDASTMVLAYTNGCESYIPTDSDFALGGYEATASPKPSAALRYGHRQALKPGAERQIRQQIEALWSVALKR
jgi:hypothetical protein